MAQRTIGNTLGCRNGQDQFRAMQDYYLGREVVAQGWGLKGMYWLLFKGEKAPLCVHFTVSPTTPPHYELTECTEEDAVRRGPCPDSVLEHVESEELKAKLAGKKSA